MRTAKFCDRLVEASRQSGLEQRFRDVLPRVQRAMLVLDNLQRLSPTPDAEVRSHFNPDGTVIPGHEDEWVVMSRGRQIEIAMAMKRSKTAGGLPRGTTRENLEQAKDLTPLQSAPRPSIDEARMQVARGSYLPEFTTAAQHSFGHYGALVVARVRVGDLTPGSGVESGWCLNHRAMIDPLFVLQTKDQSFWIQGA
jgi:hypothetical protein